MDIKVCGPGCPKCHETEQLVNEAVAESGVQASVKKVADFNEIAKLGVFTTPAIVIDGQIKCSGKVPSKKEIMEWLRE